MTLQAPVLTLDTAQAALADAGGRISTTGGYVGKLNQLKWRSSDSGAAGYVLDFESNEGQIADGLFICTVKRDGNPNDIGERQMAALMCCLGLRTITPIQSRIMEDVYNESLSRYEEMEVNAFIYPEACNRLVGIILQKELTSRVSDGQDSYRMQFIRSYQHENNRTAAEMIAAGVAKKTGQPEPPALIIARTLESIEDKDSRNKEAVTYSAPAGLPYKGGNLQPPANGAAPAEFDDDVPF